MRAVEISRFGAPDVLRVVERPKPAPGADEVLIEVAAAGVNRPDIFQRKGHYPPPPGASDLPGLEVAGTISATGRDAGRWRPGDKVAALVTGGGYAEWAVVPAAQCLPVPPGLSLVEAAALPETFFTVWTNVFDRGRLAAGEYFLVHGGSSGIGTTAIQLARAFGARVATTAGSAEKCAACLRLGASLAVNYRTDDFVAATRAFSAGHGMDLILDMVGGDYTPRNIASLADDGRLVQIALLRGAAAEVDLGVIMRRRLTLTGSTLRPRSIQAKAAIAQALEAHVWPLIERGEVKPVIHAVVPLERASEAHRMMEDGAHIGKIVLAV
jgi:putative PIG3 family NAD(P)H quinone oxidoreductase